MLNNDIQFAYSGPWNYLVRPQKEDNTRGSVVFFIGYSCAIARLWESIKTMDSSGDLHITHCLARCIWWFLHEWPTRDRPASPSTTAGYHQSRSMSKYLWYRHPLLCLLRQMCCFVWLGATRQSSDYLWKTKETESVLFNVSTQNLQSKFSYKINIHTILVQSKNLKSATRYFDWHNIGSIKVTSTNIHLKHSLPLTTIILYHNRST